MLQESIIPHEKCYQKISQTWVCGWNHPYRASGGDISGELWGKKVDCLRHCVGLGNECFHGNFFFLICNCLSYSSIVSYIWMFLLMQNLVVINICHESCSLLFIPKVRSRNLKAQPNFQFLLVINRQLKFTKNFTIVHVKLLSASWLFT